MPKLDGVRTIIRDGVAYSRTWKPLHASFQKRFKPFLELTEGTNHMFDAEVWSPKLKFNEIMHSLAHEDGEPLWIYCFDYISEEEWEGESTTPYSKRINQMLWVLKHKEETHINRRFKYDDYVRPVQVTICSKPEDILKCIERAAEDGLEGIMLRTPDQMYKHGRNTVKENVFHKFKFWETVDGIITGYKLKRELTDEAKAANTERDELGRTKRGHKKGDRQETDEIGSLEITIPDENIVCYVSFKKGSELREQITVETFDEYKGKWAEFEHLPCGAKDKLRHGRLVRLRPDKD